MRRVHAIVDGATAKASSDRAIKLIDGARSLELARRYPRTATMNFR